MKCVKEEGKAFKGLEVYSYSSGGMLLSKKKKESNFPYSPKLCLSTCYSNTF